MKIVTLSVQSVQNVIDTTLQAFSGKTQDSQITFLSLDLLWKVLAPNRMHIVKCLIGSEPLVLREVARRVGRGLKAVHTDVQLLLNSGILEKDQEGKISFLYDAIRIDIMLQADQSNLIGLLEGKTSQVATLEEINSAIIDGWTGNK